MYQVEAARREEIHRAETASSGMLCDIPYLKRSAFEIHNLYLDGMAGVRAIPALLTTDHERARDCMRHPPRGTHGQFPVDSEGGPVWLLSVVSCS